MAISYLGRVDPSVMDMFPQQIGFGENSNEMYMTQAQKLDGDEGVENFSVTHFRNRIPQSTMYGFHGHGYPMFVRVLEGVPVIYTRQDVDATTKQWIKIPYVPNYTWSEQHILEFDAVAPPTYQPPQPYWSQGRVYVNGFVYELIGGPWDNNGPINTGYGPTVLNKYNATTGALIRSESAQHCGRNSSGLPERGRVEAEGLALTKINNVDKLVLNFAAGMSWGSNPNLTCYQYTADL